MGNSSPQVNCQQTLTPSYHSISTYNKNELVSDIISVVDSFLLNFAYYIKDVLFTHNIYPSNDGKKN